MPLQAAPQRCSPPKSLKIPGSWTSPPGTGLVGEALHAEGFRNLEALDASPDMLYIAREKSVYNAYFEMTLSKHLAVVAEPYDAVVSIGTMTVGHLYPKALDEMVRSTKTGGWIVFSLISRIALNSGYGTAIDRLTVKNTPGAT